MKTLIRECRVEGRTRQRSLALVGSCGARATRNARLPRGAFTLLEVIVACAIFFMVAFAILEMVTRNLAAVRAIQKHDPDPGIVLHSLSLSNMFEEGTISGDYEDIAPGMYPGYHFEADCREIGSNGLWEVHVYSHNRKNPRQNPVEIYAHFWSPNSKPGSATKGRP